MLINLEYANKLKRLPGPFQSILILHHSMQWQPVFDLQRIEWQFSFQELSIHLLAYPLEYDEFHRDTLEQVHRLLQIDQY